VARTSSILVDDNNFLTVRNNDLNGFGVYDGSSAEVDGTLLVENNRFKGIAVRRSSILSVYKPGSATVRGTTEEGFGILVGETSTLNVLESTLLVENNTGSFGHGIYVERSSHVRFMGTGLDAQIINNQGSGVRIIQHSSGRLDPGTKINNNGDVGMLVPDNSQFYANGIEVKNNSSYGIHADDGSSANCNNCTITGNTGSDVNLTFGARGSLFGGTINTVDCDGTVLIRGDYSCP
jgi:hypothetical protein